MEFAKPQKCTATVVSKEKISAKVYLVRFAVSPLFPFVAGQTMMMYVAPGINRVMSISSSPFESGIIEMVHDVSPGGPGSQWTVGARIGDTIELMAPLGRFIVSETDAPKVFVATGTGIAPYHAMIRQLHHDGNHTAIRLYWGLRFEDDIFWMDKFEEMHKEYPEFSYTISLSQPSEAWTGSRGHVTEHVLKDMEKLKNSEFYLCGNKKMADEMRTRLLALDIEKERIYSELFF